HVGNPMLAGDEGLANGQWTIRGAGNDIWSVWDQLHFDWRTLGADGTVSAHITAQTSTDAWAKAGVMLRATTDGASPYYGAFVTPANGIVVQYRAASGAIAGQLATITGGVPAYLKVARSGTSFTTYYSPHA